MTEGKTVSSGNISMLLLQLLSEKDMYGYEMIEELEKRSEYVFSLKAGTMYPLLHAMESKKHLVSYEKEAQGKMHLGANAFIPSWGWGSWQSFISVITACSADMGS